MFGLVHSGAVLPLSFTEEVQTLEGVPVAEDRLTGLVVKASASRAEDPGFESRLRQDLFRVESYQ